jgi:hypothetical protein
LQFLLEFAFFRRFICLIGLVRAAVARLSRAGPGWVMEAYDVALIGSGLSGYGNPQFTDSDANSGDDAVFSRRAA